MIKKIFFGLVLFLSLFVSGRTVLAQNVNNITPTINETWLASDTKLINWLTCGNSYCNSTVGLGLVILNLDSNGQPIIPTNSSNLVVYDVPGQISGPGSGTISLPSNTVPQQYKVVLQIGQPVFGLGQIFYSTGNVTINNPSYQLLTFGSPSAPVSFVQGSQGFSISVTGNRILPVPTPVNFLLVNKFTQVPVWQATVDLSRLMNNDGTWNYTYANAMISGNDTVNFPVATYQVKAVMTYLGQVYTTLSPDVTITAPPAQPATLTITAPQANDYWDNSVNIVNHKVSWINPRGIPNGTRIHVVLMRPDGTHEDCNSSCRSLGYANVEAGEVVISTGAVLRLVPVGSYYVDLRVGYANPLTAPIAGRSRLFEIGSGPRVIIPTITDLSTDKTNYATGETINISWGVRNITATKNLVLKRYRVEPNPPDTFIGSATPARLFNHTVTVGSTFTTGKSYYYTLSYIPDSTVSAQSNTFTISETGGDGGDDDGIVFAAEPPDWNPPLYTPPNCTDSNGLNPDPGCFPPINVSVKPQTKTGVLTLGSLNSWLGVRILNNDSNYGLPSNLMLGVNGRVGATEYCDKTGADCYPITDLVGGEAGGVSRIIAGSNIIIDPPGGTGTVTINSTGGGGNPGSSMICDDTTSPPKKLLWNGTDWLCGNDLQGTGPMGPQGPVGPAGPAGADGADGDGAVYTADNSTLQLSATNQFSIKDRGVTPAKIAPSGINVSRVLASINGVVSMSQVSNDAIADSAVTGEKIATDAVSRTKIGTHAVGTDEIGTDAVTNSKTGITYNFFNCTDKQWGGASTACEVGTYKFCALSGVRDPTVACSVIPTTSRATSFSDFESKVITSGSISSAQWWYISSVKGGLFSSGACRAICY